MPTGIYTRTEYHREICGRANRGKKHTEEWKKQASERMMRHSVSQETREKISQTLKGVKFSLKRKKNISKALKGRKMSEEFKEKCRQIMLKSGRSFQKGNQMTKGRKHTEKSRRLMSKINKGEKGSNWKGGISPKNERIRRGIEIRLWREANFARDNWTCQKCKTRGGRLCSHHIQNFAQYPELRFAIDNGITFCKNCHTYFHSKYGTHHNNRKQLEEFLCH